jgi:hypothetical protein
MSPFEMVLVKMVAYNLDPPRKNWRKLWRATCALLNFWRKNRKGVFRITFSFLARWNVKRILAAHSTGGYALSAVSTGDRMLF